MSDDLIKLYHDQQDALGGGCSDGNCVIKKPVGMHTNGGCRCLYNLDFMGRQRVGVMLNVSQKMADRIEQLERDLAKAVEALRDMCAEFRGHDLPYGSKAYAKATATLAELEGKE